MYEVTVYIDIYLFMNLLINGSLIMTTSVLIGRKIKFEGLFASDIAASLFGLVLCLPSMSVFLSLPFKFISSFIVAKLAFGNKRLINIIKNTMIHLSVCMTYTSVVMLFATEFLFGKIIYINNSEIYYDLPIPFLILITLLIFGATALLKKLMKKGNREELLFECVIEKNGTQTSVTGLLDTGNSLRDVISGLPVIIIGKDTAGSMLYDCEKFINMESTSSEMKIIPYKTIDGKSDIMPGFRADRVTVDGNELDVIVAVSKESFMGKEYNCVLNINCFN